MNRYACIVIALAACGGGSKSSSTTPKTDTAPKEVAAGTYEVPELKGDVKCFAGPAKMENAQGQGVDVRMLYRRAWDASTSTLSEDHVTLSTNGTPPVRSVYTQKVEGTKTTVSGTYSGTGEITGTPDAWTQWKTDIKVPAGNQTMTVKSTYVMNGQNIDLTADIFDGSNAQLMQSKGTLTALDAAACKTEFSKIPPK